MLQKRDFKVQIHEIKATRFNTFFKLSETFLLCITFLYLVF